AMLRKRRRRRWFTVLPWAGSVLVSCLGSIVVPAATPPVPVPGRVLLAADASSLTAGGEGEVLYLDQATKTLVTLHLDGRHETGFTFPAVPVKVVAHGDLTFITTRGPYSVVALRHEAGRYTRMWTAPLDAQPIDLAATGSR